MGEGICDDFELGGRQCSGSLGNSSDEFEVANSPLDLLKSKCLDSSHRTCPAW